MGYVWRFINNCKVPKSQKDGRSFGPLSIAELQQTERSILREVQQMVYPEEYRILHKARDNAEPTLFVHRSSPLRKRSPYMDRDGVLRVKGRIDACSFISEDTKRPVILPKANVVTDLIIDFYHRKYRHANHLVLINEVRQRYDIPALRAACGRVRARCQLCRIKKAKPNVPMMGELPECRLSPCTRPFTFTGVDYFGPFTVVNGRKTEKRWGVLFTCLVVRAIHIEVAHTLSTSSCILALRNFIARRGTPNEIVSDRGTNFVGANRELQEGLKDINMSKIVEELNLTSVKWTFNPPGAPHFGGAWERLVQSVKKTLANIQFTKHPSDAVFNSWLMEVEFIINSRPLTDVPVDREEDSPLTPNHFLLGSSCGAKPITSYDVSAESIKNTWKTSQVYADIFWRKWVSCYLPTLTKRTKWFDTVKPITVGDVVLIVDETLPRGCWPKGRVVRAIVSRDGAVRRVHVQTASGKIIERPAVKIAVIDVSA
ncbi:uncharacterized protein LOC120908540 [Anopheles arabiensis]|uniref:uncharacterized protein LOC120908540 n=1 Tax=Anopheles arabiensis TaxID=7173 RepID=UPI001AADB803|nr:uncharacterized protein LOC120908540 [Anopheles arabiensis]